MAWYSTAWTKRKKITIPAAKVHGSSAISGVPVFFNPSVHADIVAGCRPDGHDLLFTAADGVTKLPHELLSDKQFLTRDGAWSFYSGPHGVWDATAGQLYVGTVDPSGNQEVHQWVASTGAITTTAVNVLDSGAPDDHREPTLVVRPSDGKLVVFYLNAPLGSMSYRISSNAHDATAWGNETALDPNSDGHYSYHTPLVVGSNIYLFYVHISQISPINSRLCYIKSTDGGATWGTAVILTSIANAGWDARPYPVCSTNGTSRIDVVISAGSPQVSGVYRPFIHHFYLDTTTDTLRNSTGTAITSPPFDSSETTLIYNGSPDFVWTHSRPCYDRYGRPHVLFYLYVGSSDEATYTNQDLMHATCDGSGRWTVTKVMDEGTGYASGSPSYAGASCLDPDDDNIMWASVEVSDVYEIQKWTRASGTWAKVEDVTTGSASHHIRPSIAWGCPTGTRGRLLFYSTTSYTSYDSFAGGITTFPALGYNFRRCYIRAGIHGGTDTPIFCYYGNPTAADQQDAAGTWADYVRVYHGEERYGETPGHHRESSGNGSRLVWTLVTVGENPSDNIGRSLTFNGTNQKANLGTPNMASWTAATFECFAKYDSSGSDEHDLLMQPQDTTAGMTLRLEPTDDTVEVFMYAATNSFKGGTVSDISVVANTWHYVAAIAAAAVGLKARVDKTEGSVASTTFATFDETASGILWAGGPGTGTTDWLTGNLAEIRISNNRALSKDQTDTQHDMWTDADFLTLGDEQSVGSYAATAVRSDPNADAAVELVASPVTVLELASINYSYSASPTGGNLLVESPVGTPIFELDITDSGMGALNFHSGLRGASGQTIAVTLAAGGANVVGVLDVRQRG